MLWNLILIAAEPAAEAVTPEVTVEAEHKHHKKARHHKARHHKAHINRKALTKETDAITKALNAGAMPLMPAEKQKG